MDKNKLELLPDKYKVSIIQAMTDAVRSDIDDFLNEFHLESFNGIDFLKWDFINTNLVRNSVDGRLIAIKLKRGRWTLILLYDTELKYLYALMRHKRFWQLQDQRKSRVQPHYIDALSYLNKDVHAENDQLCLFDNDDWDKEVKGLLHNIIPEYHNEISRFILIGFSTTKDEIARVSAIVPTADLQIALELDWSEFIPANYDSVEVAFDFTATDEDEEIPIKLKGISEISDDSMVRLKNENRKYEKES